MWSNAWAELYVGVHKHRARGDKKDVGLETRGRYLCRLRNLCQSLAQTHQNPGEYQRSICICESCVVPLASKIPLAAEAAARGVLRPLTFHLCGGCAVAICANSKIGYNFLWLQAAVCSTTERKPMWCNIYANLFTVAAWPYNMLQNIESIYSLCYIVKADFFYNEPVWYVPTKNCQSFSITSIHATAGRAAPPTATFRTALLLLSSLPWSLTPSLMCCERIDFQSKLTKWKQAAHLWPHWANRAYNQNKRQEPKAEERWEFALSVKSLWDNAAVGLLKHKCEYNAGN